MGGLVERFQVGVERAAIGGTELVEREFEIGAELDERQDAPLGARHSVARRRGDICGAPQIGGGIAPAMGPGEVDELARGESGGQPLAGLVVEL